MKILITGDWHIDNKAPKRRTDDYWKTIVNKLNFILDLYVEHKCKFILQPGDFFNSHRANDFLKSYMIELLEEIDIFCVYGQHDMRYHNIDIKNTPLNVLDKAGAVTVLWDKPEWIKGLSGGTYLPTYLYGCSWGDEIPEKDDMDGIHILVMHKMVIKDEDHKLWYAQEDFITADRLDDLEFDLIVTGDNHQGFSHGNVFNCGSLMRSTIAQVDHKPHVWIYDTEENDATRYDIPVQPFEEVMDMDTAIAEKVRNEELEAFVNGLQDDPQTQDLDFTNTLNNYMKENKIPVDVKEIITTAMLEEK